MSEWEDRAWEDIFAYRNALINAMNYASILDRSDDYFELRDILTSSKWINPKDVKHLY